MLPDEECHVSSEPQVLGLSEILYGDFSGEVSLHNTMRFDINLAYVELMIDDGDVDINQVASEVRSAIIEAIERTLGMGLDGRPIPGGANVVPVAKSKMLHRETICFDLS